MSSSDPEGSGYPDLSCSCCERKEVELFVCGQCQSTLYCSDTCKGWDWSEDGHKEICRGYVGVKHSARQPRSHRRNRASNITPEKAYEMIHNPPRGQPLSDKQRRLFWWIYNGRKSGHSHHTHTERPLQV